MSDILKMKYKIGEIEFEAEGPAEVVEKQRINFMNTVLPSAVKAMVQTQAVAERQHYIETTPQSPMLETGIQTDSDASNSQLDNDFSRTSLSSFLKKYGALSDQDFVLFAAFFDEKKNGRKAFSSENVKQYYQDGRRPAYSNNSALLAQLVKKGYIMDTAVPEGTKPGKYYMLTDAGFNYIETYIPKEDSSYKQKTHRKSRKATASISEAYATITADDLDIKSYPAIKDLSGVKEQVIMAMYIVTKAGKGEWFTVDDIIHLLVNIFEVPTDSNKVNGVFMRNKSMFASEQDPNNKKALRRKLLSGAKDFAVDIIRKNSAK